MAYSPELCNCAIERARHMDGNTFLIELDEQALEPEAWESKLFVIENQTVFTVGREYFTNVLSEL